MGLQGIFLEIVPDTELSADLFSDEIGLLKATAARYIRIYCFPPKIQELYVPKNLTRKTRGIDQGMLILAEITRIISTEGDSSPVSLLGEDQAGDISPRNHSPQTTQKDGSRASLKQERNVYKRARKSSDPEVQSLNDHVYALKLLGAINGESQLKFVRGIDLDGRFGPEYLQNMMTPVAETDPDQGSGTTQQVSESSSLAKTSFNSKSASTHSAV
jgi:hypothetical protein